VLICWFSLTHARDDLFEVIFQVVVVKLAIEYYVRVKPEERFKVEQDVIDIEPLLACT
jgi:hypothetical protein